MQIGTKNARTKASKTKASGTKNPLTKRVSTRAAANKNKDVLPIGDLGIIALESSQEMGRKINDYIVEWRTEREHKHSAHPQLTGYVRDNYLIRTQTPRFGSGEGKATIYDSIRGYDIFLLLDVCNYSITYTMRGQTNHMSPDDHFIDLERIIAAIGGKARRINVIMPYLYESRQHRRSGRESLDCAQALKELVRMGVDNIITFDAHDPRIQNAIPLSGFENFLPTYQFIKGLFRAAPDFSVSPDSLMIVSPDEAGTSRAVYMANVLGVDMGMFYKRRNYTLTVKGENPIVAHEFLGASVKGKDVVLLDDMISSGNTALQISRELKALGARRIFICATFGLFTDGLEKFDEAWKNKVFHSILTTNLIYQKEELLAKPYYRSCDLSKFVALIIDSLNHDSSLSDLLDPVDRINRFLKRKGARRS